MRWLLVLLLVSCASTPARRNHHEQILCGDEPDRTWTVIYSDGWFIGSCWKAGPAGNSVECNFDYCEQVVREEASFWRCRLKR